MVDIVGDIEGACGGVEREALRRRRSTLLNVGVPNVSVAASNGMRTTRSRGASAT